jgi:hypothetical protein
MLKQYGQSYLFRRVDITGRPGPGRLPLAQDVIEVARRRMAELGRGPASDGAPMSGLESRHRDANRSSQAGPRAPALSVTGIPARNPG